MGFVDRECVALKAGQLGGEAEELLHADGEVGAIEKRAALLCEGLQLVEVFVPAGGADDDAAAERKHGADVFKGCAGSGEVDDDIDAGEVGRGEGGGVLVFRDVERAHTVAALARDIRDQTSCFSFT